MHRAHLSPALGLAAWALLAAPPRADSQPVPKPATTKPAPPPVYKTATVYVTARDSGDRLRAGTPLPLADADPPDEWNAAIMLDPAKRFQTIVGFGGTFTDAAAETYARLPAARRAEVLRAYFSPTQGSGYTLGRTTINSCDFSSDTYSYDDVPGDVSLSHFSVAHDLRYRVPFIKAALAVAQSGGSHFSLFASPWSPPAWMKTNGEMAHGGRVKPEDRQAWADYYVRFIREYGRQGVPVWGLTVQNEPLASQSWESCNYSGAEERDFVRDFLGPALRRAGLSGVRLMIWDHNRGLMFQRAQAVYDDPAAARYVWGTAFHWYTGDHFDNTQAVHEAYPAKALLFTEGTAEGMTADPARRWASGERYGRNVLLDLSHWSQGWTDWNLLVDSRGGPNHAGNFCAAPIIADVTTGALDYQPSYYYLGHFARFIRPGARRVSDTSNDDRLQSVAFLNPDGTLAVVVLNLTDEGRDYQVWLSGRAVRAVSPAHSIETVLLRP